MKLPCFRDEFLLDDRLLYLNHGSLGGVPAPVLAEYHRLHRELEANPIEFLDRRLPERIHQARSRAAAYLGASPERLVFVEGVTVGLNQVLNAIRLAPGDEILLGSLEYGAYRRIWERFAASGAVIRTIPFTPPFGTPDEIARTYRDAMTGRTRLLFVSHVTSSTALVLPVPELCRLARERGVTTVVDGAHAVSQLDLTLDAWAPDFYVGTFHKWLGAPRGSGFLYASGEKRRDLPPLVVSWGGELNGASGDPFLDDALWTGTRDYAAFLTVPAAIDYQERRNWPAVRELCRAAAREGERFFRAELGLDPVYRDPDASIGQMFSLLLPFPDPLRLRDEIARRHRIELQAGRWEGRTLVRISVQCHTPPDEFPRVARALREMLDEA